VVVFQGFLEANLKCFWNASLLEAMRLLEFQGYVAPGVLLVTASACALEVVRAAWARNVLKPPNNYVISVVGELSPSALLFEVRGFCRDLRPGDGIYLFICSLFNDNSVNISRLL
jgi:hypothetical protein